VLCEALRNVHLDRLLFFLSVSLINLRSGREGVVGVRQPGLEITDDRAEKARREKPRPEGAGRILTDGRQLSRAALAAADIRPSCQQVSSLTASGRSGAASPAALAAYAAAPRACAPI
jgi:hypothetical protein